MEFFACLKHSVPFVVFCRTVLTFAVHDKAIPDEQNTFIKELDAFYGTYHSQAQVLDVIYYTPTREASIILRQFKRVAKKRPRTSEGVARKPFVVVEGLYAEGGRRVVSNFLASRFNGVHLENPPHMYYDIRSGLAHHSSAFRRAFYSLANYVVARQASRWLDKRPVFMSRYWHNFASYAIAKATANRTYMMPPKNSLVYSWPSDLLKPDYVFFVNTSTHDQIVHYWNFKGQVKGFQQRRAEAFINMYDPAVVDISAQGTLSDVATRIISYLEKEIVFSSLVTQ